MLVVLSEQTAVQLSTVAVFGAADPWGGMRPATWTLSVYRVVSGSDRDLFATYAAERQAETVDGQNLDPDDTLGIRSGTQPYHLLPRAMVRLWQQGKVPTEALPRLVAQMEPELRRDRFAYISPAAGRHWLRPFGWICLAGGLFSVMAGLVNNYVRHVEDSGLCAGLVMLGVILLACAAAFLLLGRPRRGVSQRQTRRILEML